MTPIKLTFREARPEAPAVGDCWFAPWLIGSTPEGARLPTHFLSDRFIAGWNLGTRAPLIVRIPGAGGAEAGAFDFCIDGPFWNDGVRDGTGWTVTIPSVLTLGEMPDVTVEPSINVGKGWHGWLKHGLLTNA